MGSPISAMALKALLILAALGLVYSENSHCSAFSGANGNDGRDCTCGDKAFEDCIEPVTDDQIHTADFAECKFQAIFLSLLVPVTGSCLLIQVRMRTATCLALARSPWPTT